MTVESISKGLKFRNLNLQEDVQCKDVNIIYGTNGSGKTTFSEALRCLDQPEVATHVVAARPVVVHVFNSEYVDRELRQFTFGDGGARSIAIGKGDIEQQELKLQYESEISNAEVAYEAISKRLGRLKTEKKIGEAAKQRVIEALGEHPGYTSFQYQNNAALIDKISRSMPCSDATALKTAEEMLSAEMPSALTLAPCPKELIASAVQEACGIARNTPQVSGAELSDLKADFREWLRQGLDFMDHDAESGNCCPFCLGPVDPVRASSLRETFDSETAKLISRARSHRGDLIDIRETVRSLQAEWREREHVDSVYEPDIPRYTRFYASWLGELEGTINTAIEIVEQKKENPSMRGPAKDIDIPDFDIKPLNDAISRHNGSCDANQSNRNSAIDLIEADCLSQFTDELKDLRGERSRFQRALDSVSQRKRGREEALARLRAVMSSKVESAAKISSILNRTLGVPRIQIEVSYDELTYHLVRDGGGDARHLSEGERQAIALAYFIQSLESDDVQPGSSIVFLDDPVVALDDHGINVALYMIREATKNFAQLFFSTHSFQVLKRAARVWGAVPDVSVSYMEARKNSEWVCSIYPLPDRYLEFAGEYQYLFARMAGAAFGADSEMSFDSRNVARRVLESFLEFHVPVRDGSLRSMLEAAWDADGTLKEFAPLVRGVVTTYNSGSHSVSAASSLDPWTYPTREEVRLCYGTMVLLNQRHARNMLNAIFPIKDWPDIHSKASEYSKKVTAVKKRMEGGVDPNFDVILPSKGPGLDSNDVDKVTSGA
ncbi:AAA family ATPase [Corynebacterium appendicis]|uniref:AAA family ATPase n=1 Tax=Corynebacterium appendicis TaxID=163202 RepID=UPI002357C11B|nr:AAA family ATPase [Corynebacterium appendicis]